MQRREGHRLSSLEWIASGRESDRFFLPESHYFAMLHAMTLAKCSEWLGIREPASFEALILSTADRYSGHMDLLSRIAPKKPRRLKNRPYIVLDSGFSSGSLD